MISRLWTAFLISLACASTIAWLVALMHEKNIRPVQDLVTFFKKQSKVGRVLLGTFFIAMWVIASTKPGNGGGNGGGEGGGDGGTNNVPQMVCPPGGLDFYQRRDAETQSPGGEGSLTGFTGLTGLNHAGLNENPANLVNPVQNIITSTNTTRTLDGDDFRRGFVMTRAGMDEAFSFAAPAGANVCADWRAFGAASDWIYLAFEDWAFQLGANEVDRLRVFSFGKVDPLVRDADGHVATNCWFAPFVASLGIVPQAGWPLVAGNENAAPEDLAPSRFWHFVTPSNTLQLTWQNVLLGRLTNTPVSVQMEVWPSGRFTYRYDLSRLDVEEVTNALVGACFGGLEWATNSIPTNLTSLAFYPLLPEDAANEDRDGDGLSLLDELFFHDTDPGLWDTDCDGVSDGDEVAAGTNPLARDTDGDGFLDGTDVNPLLGDAWTDTDGDGLPDVWKDGWFGPNAMVAASGDANTNGVSNIASLLMGLNPIAPPAGDFTSACGGRTQEINAWEISPVAFDFARPEGLTNIISRTFAIGRESPWEQFFISSRADMAGGWKSADVAILYGLDGEPATNAVSASSGDSWRIPLGDTMPQSVSVRILATGDAPCLSAPLYLLRWTPRVEFLPSANVTVVGATNGCTYAAAKRNPDTGAYEVPFHADTAKIPHRAGIDAAVAADLAMPPAEYVSVSEGTPRAFTASDPLMADLPREGTNLPKRLLFYSIDFSRTGAVSSGPRSSQYASPYPLSSSSLRKSFHAATGETADGSVTLTLSPDVPELGYTTGLPVLRGGLRLMGAAVGGSKEGTVMPPTTVTPTIFGDPCTNDTHEVECEYPEDHDETHDEDEDPDDNDDDDDCGCGDGGSSLGSFRIRIPFGESASDERLGYLWMAVEGPVAITPSAFGVLAAQGVSVATNVNGTLSISCASAGGKTLMVTNIAHGVAVPVWNASGRFESEWQVWNEDGDASRIRVRRVTVAGNATVDETYATWNEDEPVVFWETRSPSTVWEKSDNIRGVAKRRYEWRDADEPDFIISEYDETYLDGNLVRAEERTYAKVGEGSTARRRLVRTYGYDENGWHETVRTYWCDTDHLDRHARLKSVRSDRQPWAWHDYDASGRETVRIEQLDGSPFPELADVSPDAVLPQWCSARVTVTDYTPQEGDDAHRNDSFEPREISVYVRRGGDAPILVSHEARTYTRETDSFWNPLRRIVKTVGFGGMTRTETTVEYPQDGAVPSHLRGLRTLVSNADGSETATAYALSNGCLVATAHTTFNNVERKTYTRSVTDAAYRLPLREESRLSSDGSLLEWSDRTYDDIRRLRSVAYSDGTSETNSYSCCRLLWRRDREGRKVLRSAQTGTDSLYYAEEAVWLSDVSTNGAYRIVRHFFDGFGRETETVTHTGTAPGEATMPYEPSADQTPSRTTTEYFDDWLGGYSETTDERGAVTTRWRSSGPSSESQSETVLTNGTDVLTTTTTAYRNGGTTIRREWTEETAQSPYRWTEERRFTDYAADGRRIEYVVTESSDCGTVTNSVSTYDQIGRLASSAVRGANGSTIVTSNAYEGMSSRILSSIYTAGDVVRTTTYLYNDFGEQVGTVLDGVTSRNDIIYEQHSNEWWKVETSSVIGPSTNSLTIVRTQLTGLSDACRRHEVAMVGHTDPIASFAGTVTETVASFDPETGIETETVTSTVAAPVVSQSLYGFVLTNETSGTATVNAYDALGRVAATFRTIGEGYPAPLQSFDYVPCGDLIASHTYTNFIDYTTESYAYDMLGNRIATTDALGNTIYKSYDAIGNVIAEWGATYPVRYTYDTAGRRTSMTTFRDVGGSRPVATGGDTTIWAYDAATGNCLSKTYADGSTVTYTYTPDNLPLRTTYASGRWKENVYDERRQIVGVIYSDDEVVSLAYDEFGSEIAASNEVSSVVSLRSEQGDCTNETVVVSGGRSSSTAADETLTISRTFDVHRRLTGIDGTIYDYNADGLLVSISTAIAVVNYAYTPDRLDAGYSLTLSNGVGFIRNILRDGYRRSLVTDILSVANGVGVGSLAYTYDALSRPTSRNNDTFGYNERGEVVFSLRDAENAEESYSYDNIGNLLFSAFNSATNTYTANNLNQYTSVLCASAPLLDVSHDVDGNMLSDGVLTFTYDAANRLKTVSSNGVLLVTNFYDAKSRRVKKVTSEATTTFFYDGWNLIEERIADTNGTSSTIHYYWGKDLSGTLQGAGGVGGLLYLTIDGVPFIPCYDNIGNITRYFDAYGNTVAQYTYDAFGNTISQYGAMCGVFRHRFSTKCYDTETGLYYYGYRFYNTILMRWLNRDPIEECDGCNLYIFVANRPSYCFDKLGLYRWVAIYYSRADQPEFKRAAETYKRDIEQSKTFNPRCDSVIIKGALTAGEFRKVWDEINNETRREGNRYKIKSLHIFTHSGPGILFLRGTSLSASRIEALARLNWAADGNAVCHGCNTGIHDEDGNSVARSLATGQGVKALGQTGFSQFSESPNRRTWFTRIDGNSQNVYLWSYGDGGPSWTFGAARIPQTERPLAEVKK